MNNEEVTESVPEAFNEITVNGKRYCLVTINGKNFRISRVSAITGVWIAKSFTAFRSEETSKKILTACLELCEILTVAKQTGAQVPMQIISGETWLWPDLQYDFDTVDELFDAAVNYNFSDFSRRQLKKAAELQAQLAVLKSSRSPSN